MKAFALVLTSLFAINAHADVKAPQPQTVATLAPLELVSAEPLCPAGVTCVANGTVVTMKLIVSCGQKLGTVSAQAVEVGDELHVFAAAALQTTRDAIVCLGFKEQIVQATFINQYGEVKLHSLHERNVAATLLN